MICKSCYANITGLFCVACAQKKARVEALRLALADKKPRLVIQGRHIAVTEEKISLCHKELKRGAHTVRRPITPAQMNEAECDSCKIVLSKELKNAGQIG